MQAYVEIILYHVAFDRKANTTRDVESYVLPSLCQKDVADNFSSRNSMVCFLLPHNNSLLWSWQGSAWLHLHGLCVCCCCCCCVHVMCVFYVFCRLGVAWLYYGNVLLTTTFLQNDPHCRIRRRNMKNNTYM